LVVFLPFAGEEGFAAAGGFAGEVDVEGGVEVWDAAKTQAELAINPRARNRKVVRTFIEEPSNRSALWAQGTLQIYPIRLAAANAAGYAASKSLFFPREYNRSCSRATKFTRTKVVNS
jgi:hypothetical protein